MAELSLGTLVCFHVKHRQLTADTLTSWLGSRWEGSNLGKKCVRFQVHSGLIQVVLCKRIKPFTQLGSGQALRTTHQAVHLSTMFCLFVSCFSQKKTLPASLVSTYPGTGRALTLASHLPLPFFLIIFQWRVCWEYVIVETLVKKAIRPIKNRLSNKKLNGKLNGLPLGSMKLSELAQHYNVPYPTCLPSHPSSSFFPEHFKYIQTQYDNVMPCIFIVKTPLQCGQIAF